MKQMFKKKNSNPNIEPDHETIETRFNFKSSNNDEIKRRLSIESELSSVGSAGSVGSVMSKVKLFSKIPEQHIVPQLHCQKCNEKCSQNLIILSCGHIFHTGCLVKQHFIDIEKSLKSECACFLCNKFLDATEILFIHGKYTVNTQSTLDSYEQDIIYIENEISKMNKNLREVIENKRQLEFERKKSKEIMFSTNNS